MTQIVCSVCGKPFKSPGFAYEYQTVNEETGRALYRHRECKYTQDQIKWLLEKPKGKNDAG